MTLYDLLDAIADSFNPGLGMIAMAQLLRISVHRQWQRAGIYLATLLALTTVIYGLMAVDRNLFDFPYSTHSAFAACFCTLHAAYMPRFKLLWMGLLVCYLGLILFQGYHSWLDIAVTLILVMPFIAIIFKLLKPSRALSYQQ
ncbi:MAG: hypothetical protein KA365_04990 [Arenimonas sp.]|nr:hypothetical protein [Arenimonas sp.]